MTHGQLTHGQLTAQTSVPRSRYLVFLGIAATGCAADLLSKHWIFQWLGVPFAGGGRDGGGQDGGGQDNVWWLWENYVGIQTTLNRGALFGFGEGGGRIFAGLSIVAAIGIVVWLFALGSARSVWLTVALSLITGGILGNLYDRLGFWVTPDIPEPYHFAVRDWILFRARHEAWTWPNFNIADSLLVGGANMLLWQGYWEKPDPPAPEAAQQAG